MSMNPVQRVTRTERTRRVLASHSDLIIFVMGIVVGFLLSRV